MERSPFHVHSLNHGQPHTHTHSHKKSTGSQAEDEDDLRRRCSCLNHRHRFRPPTPEKKRPEGSYLSRMSFSRDPFGQGYTNYGQTWPHGYRPPSAPSTPGSAAKRRSGGHGFPTTTPAGPGPLLRTNTNRSTGGTPRTNRTSRSTTPSGPPPRSSVFGGSQNSPTPSRSQSRPFGTPSQRGRSMSTYAGASRGRGSGIPVLNRSQSAGGFYKPPVENRSKSANDYYMPGTSPEPPFFEDEESYFDEHDPGCQFHHDNFGPDADTQSTYEDDRMEGMGENVMGDNGMGDNGMGDNGVIGEEREDEAMEDSGKLASRKSSRPVSPTKSVRDNQARVSSAGGSPVRSPAKSRLGVNRHTYDIGGIAKSIAATARPVNTLREPDSLILQTERILNALGESDATEEALSAACKELGKLWNHPHKPIADIVGPAESDSPLAKVDFVTSLLLQLHHPPPTGEKNALTLSTRGQRSAFSSSFGRPSAAGRETPMPKVLLDWLATHHDPSAPDFEQFKSMGGNYSSRAGYWDTIFASVMRGSFEDALLFLKGGNFSVAESALEDGYATPGYTGTQLVNVNRAVHQAIEVLESCPAYNNDDWDVKGSDWMLFRRTVASTIEDLRIFSEGEGQRTDDYFNASQGDIYSFSTASRRAVSQVPWAVYENLQILYDLLLGKPEEILQTSFDWLEAVICMTAWWDGEDEEDAPQNSFAMARRTLRARTADATPKQAYRQRLGASLARILAEDDPGLTINSNNPVEVALACIMEENMEGLVNILRCWSMMATTAVVEVASTGGWLGDTKNLMKGFDQSDLMVLSFGQGRKQGISKDELLEQYAELLFSKTQVQGSEGWELAIQVLGRLDHAETAKEKISELLDRLPLSSAERVDKILDVCNNLGLVEHANTIAERYATSLAENSYNYGSALFYYARAHNPKKIRDVLDLLISLCLIHSTAYPPQADLDDRLRSLIGKPKQTLSQLSRTDLEAAQMLSMYLSGYATLRKFYDLRDEEVNSEGKVAHRPLERKRQAAAALVAVVNSAADSIRGGLYDPSADAVVQVDGLLTLLGETLPFVNQPKRLISLADLATLSQAVEDLQTAPSLVYAQCEEHLQATLGQVHGGGAAPTASSAILKKSISSSYSLVGGSTTEGSGVLVDRSEGALDAKRGWDWRRGVQSNAKGRDVCGVLRLGIAREVGRAWAEGAVW